VGHAVVGDLPEAMVIFSRLRTSSSPLTAVDPFILMHALPTRDMIEPSHAMGATTRGGRRILRLVGVTKKP
jgi:hypothetical protein